MVAFTPSEQPPDVAVGEICALLHHHVGDASETPCSSDGIASRKVHSAAKPQPERSATGPRSQRFGSQEMVGEF
jgi:hypothetical protein